MIRKLASGRKEVSTLSIAATIFFIVSGGPYSVEQVIGKSGPLFGLLILILLPLFWSLPICLMTAELSSKYPEEGGYIVWVDKAFGPFASFLCGWWSWTSSWVDLALFPLIAVQYAARVTGKLSHPHVWVIGIILALTLWNLLGIGKVGRLSNLLLSLLLLPFGAIVGIGLVRWVQHPVHLPMLNPGVESAGIGTAIVFALWNYFGWDSVTTTLAEIPDAPRRVPKSVLIAVGMVTAMIVLPVFAALALKTDWPNWASDAGYWPEIASSAWLPLRSVVILGGVVSNVGQFNANLLASSRIPYVLSRRNCLPRVFSLEHPLFRTPWVGIAFGGILSALLASESFEKLVAIDLSLYLIALILECGALVKLRRGLLIEPKSHFQIGGGQLGLILCAAFPILIGVIAICLQLSPSLHIADTTINPISIFVGLALSGPIVYAAGLASKRLGAK